MIELDESTLLAYVDGKLSGVELEQVEAVLKTDARARAVVERLRANPPPTRAAFDKMVGEPVPPALLETVMWHQITPRRSLWSRRTAVIAASICALIISAGGGFFAGMQYWGERESIAASDDWVIQVAQYHKLYARETLHIPTFPEEQVRDLEAWLGERIGEGLRILDLSDFGLQFKRGQVLMVDEKLVAQLAYLPVEGQPIAVCIIKTGEADQEPVESQAEGLNLVHWHDQGYAYVIMGKAEDVYLKDLVEAMRKKMPS